MDGVDAGDLLEEEWATLAGLARPIESWGGGFRRRATPLSGAYPLMLPIGVSDTTLREMSRRWRTSTTAVKSL